MRFGGPCGLAITWGVLAACSAEPELPPTEPHLFDDMSAWRVAEPRGRVFDPVMHDRIVEVLSPGHRVEDAQDAVWVSEEIAAARWQARHEWNQARPDASFWFCRVRRNLALPQVLVTHPAEDLVLAAQEPLELPVRSYRLWRDGFLMVLPAGSDRPAGVSLTFPLAPADVIGSLSDSVAAPEAAPAVRATTLVDETRVAVMMPPPMALRRPVRVPEGGRLHLAVGCREGGLGLMSGALVSRAVDESDGAGFRLVLWDDDEPHVLLDEFVPPEGAGRFHPHVADLSPWAGQAVEIELSTYGGRAADGTVDNAPARCRHDFAFVSEPLLTGANGDEPERPNVLVVLLDTMRADALSCYGGSLVQTPNLDQLAADGVLFENARSSSPWTLPAHASLFASLLPSQHGVLHRSQKLPAAVDTFPEVVRAAGWRTLAVTGGAFVTPTFGMGQGFDRFQSENTPFDAKVAMMLEWIDDVDAPFVAFLHTFEVHTPYAPIEPYRSRHVPDYDGPLPEVVDIGDLQRYVDLGETPTEEDLDYVRGLYHAEVAYTDAVMGDLFAELRKRGLWENTLVIVTSDHGEEFWDHGDHTHSKTLYEEMLRVPMIVHHPVSFAGGQRVPAPVRLVDIAPTITEFLGVPSPQSWVGTTMAGTGAPRDVLATVLVRRAGEEVRAYASVEGEHKCIEAPLGFYRTDDRVGSQLFDLASDPGERDPVRDGPHLERLLAKVAELKGRYPVSIGDGMVDLSPEELDELRALGYVK